MSIVYLNGEFLPLDEAKIPVMDRGFLFGDGIYEVIPVYNFKLFRLSQHLVRLRQSLAAVDIHIPLSDDELDNLFKNLLEKNADCGPFQLIYFHVTRGVGKSREHVFTKALRPTIFSLTKTVQFAQKSDIMNGKSAISSVDIRWHRCDIKSISLLANILLIQEAHHHNANETILIRDGFLTEGGSSNVFIVKNAIILTPPLSQNILGGVTRDLVIDIAREHNIPLEVRPISHAELLQADEIWITSSTREIIPIVTLDGNPVNTGKSGPVWDKMFDYYQHYVTHF